MPDNELEELLTRVRKRYTQLRNGSCQQTSFLAHVRSLATWEQDTGSYPDAAAEFPNEIYIAYACCQPDCGVKEFVVDGSTQECQHCGRLMFRTEVRKYKLAE